MRTRPSPDPLTRHWGLDPQTVFLNHGSYGACPTQVLEAQDRYRRQLEAEPVRFMLTEMEGLLDGARSAVGEMINARADEIAFVRNATVGLATILYNLDLKAGDEVVVNDHEYPSVLHELSRTERRAGVKLVRAKIPFPIASEDEVVGAIDDAITARTKAVVISHVTSPTGLVMPVERITRLCRERGVVSIVDAAHSLGQVAFDVEAIAPDYISGNLHKWTCAPKGAGFLWVPRDRQKSFDTLHLSSRAGSGRTDRDRFHILFDYTGTDDPTPAIASRDALEFVGSLMDGGWGAIRARNHALVIDARRLICERLSVEPPAPESMLGSMAAMILPAPPGEPVTVGGYEDAIQRELVERFKIQVPVWTPPDMPVRIVRISAHLYNSIEQYEYLAEALAQVLKR